MDGMLNGLNGTPDWLYSLILTSASIIVGLILYMIIAFLINRSSKLPIMGGVDVRSKWIKGPLLLLIPAICFSAVRPFLRIPEDYQGNLTHALSLFILFLVTWLIIRIIHVSRDVILGRYDISAKDNLKARRIYTQIRVIERIIIIAILILAVAAALMSFPKIKQLGVSLLASAGIFGIVLGFAAQKTLGNIVAGIQIAMAQPIRLDDVVIVENEWGRIEEINLIYVVVKIWDQRRLVIPISYFIENPFQNWTRTSADILGTVYIYADYTVPVGEIRKELSRLLNESEYWDKKVDVLQVTNTTEKTVELRALMSAENSSIAWNLRCEVREKLLDYLQKNHPQCLPKTRVELDKKSS
jgi:small-conductance mechanosensitive channel